LVSLTFEGTVFRLVEIVLMRGMFKQTSEHDLSFVSVTVLYK